MSPPAHLVPLDRTASRGAAAAAAAAAPDLDRIARAVREILLAIGEDPEREGLRDTPARVARAYAEICGGLHEDATAHLGRVFHEGTDDLVIVRDLEVRSLCEHHLLPFFGRAHIAYLPGDGRVVGLSKLGRVVDAFARRPQVQERLTTQLADAIVEHLGARGVSVLIEAEHLCMRLRGVRSPEARTTTIAHRGVLREHGPERTQVLALLARHGAL